MKKVNEEWGNLNYFLVVKIGKNKPKLVQKNQQMDENWSMKTHKYIKMPTYPITRQIDLLSNSKI